MANQPKQEKRVCVLCGQRSRKWKDGPTGYICEDEEACKQRIAEKAPKSHADEPAAETPLTTDSAETPVSVEASQEIEAIPQVHRVGTTHQEFDIILAPHDLRSKGASLSQIVLEIQQVEAEKAETVAEFGARIKGLKKRLNETAEVLRSGKTREYRTAAIMFEPATKKVRYVDPVSGVVYMERDVEPGEQFRLPLDDKAEPEKPAKPDCFGIPGSVYEGDTDQLDCVNCPVVDECEAIEKKVENCYGKALEIGEAEQLGCNDCPIKHKCSEVNE